jgi:hypothetical protein
MMHEFWAAPWDMLWSMGFGLLWAGILVVMEEL